MCTAGVMALVRPCGIFVNTTEMYTCESPTQVYLFLVMKCARANDIDRLKYLGYDRACDLTWRQRQHTPNKHVMLLVDNFHVAKHTEPCCMPPDNPLCKYPPSLPPLTEIHGVDTECAKQFLSVVKQTKTLHEATKI